MRQKALGGIILVAIALMVFSCGDDDTPAPAAAAPVRVGEEVNLRTVESGDTIGVYLLGANITKRDAKVRLLGVSACDPNTGKSVDAHNAALHAAGQHDGGTSRVWLTTEPGAPDSDASGALLRYVRMGDGSDLGELLVTDPHIGVASEGPASSASQEYLARLRQLDTSGRDCVDPPLPSPETAQGGGGDTTYVPVPGNGHDDGDDGESRFCRHRRWC